MKMSEYLKLKRASTSQEALCTELQKFDKMFSMINPVTLSRWENGVCTPTLSKFCKLVTFFGDDTYSILPNIEYKVSNKRKKAVDFILGKMNFSPNGEQIGNLRLKGIYDSIDLTKKFNNPLAEALLEFDHSIFNTTYPVTIKALEQWAAFPSNVCLINTWRKNYFGHLVILRLEKNCYEGLITGNLEESEISTSDFARTHEPHYFYIYSINGYSKLAASYMLLEISKQVFLSKGNCMGLGGICATHDGARLAKAMGLSPVTIGPENCNSDIYVNGKHVEWVTYEGDICTVFSSFGESTLAAVQKSMSVM